MLRIDRFGNRYWYKNGISYIEEEFNNVKDR